MRVLIVDDEYMIRKGMQKMIDGRCEGFLTAGSAKDGEEAIRAAESCRPDILISDIRMPGMDGLELAGWMEKQMPEVVVILLTGYDDFIYVQSALKQGVFDYILKPVDEQELQTILKRAGEESDKRKKRKYRDLLLKAHIEGKISLIYAMVTSSEFLTDIMTCDETVADRLTDRLGEYTQGLDMEDYLYAQLVQGVYNTIIEMIPNADQYSGQADFGRCRTARQVNLMLKQRIHGLIDCLKQRQDGRDQADRMKEYIYKHYGEDITLQSLGERFGLTAGYVSDVFKRYGEKCFHDFLTEVRIGKAIELLEDPSLKIPVIAGAIGYRDPNYFYKVFKRVTGMTPKQFRDCL